FYKVAAINSVGKGPNSTEVSATPFNRIPECNITNPTSGTTVSGSYAVAGTANDTDGTVERVEIRIDDGPWTQANGTTSWSYQWNTTTLDDGNHTIYARSFDGMNNSFEVNVTVVVGNAVSPPPPDEDESIFEQAWVWVVVALVIIVVVAVLLLLVRKRKQRREGDQTSETREPP
ncbi:MAG: Ig-like domain-containing protein, partial [Candidatus Thermoplasmatota archaeon]|nr:Ig-like domain-containing protein [Candidatus Thermoplasmatota archaeon]